jgi:hypothetical protein
MSLHLWLLTTSFFIFSATAFAQQGMTTGSLVKLRMKCAETGDLSCPPVDGACKSMGRGDACMEMAYLYLKYDNDNGIEYYSRLACQNGEQKGCEISRKYEQLRRIQGQTRANEEAFQRNMNSYNTQPRQNNLAPAENLIKQWGQKPPPPQKTNCSSRPVYANGEVVRIDTNCESK